MDNSLTRGKKGEEQAVAALEAAGMAIIVRNYRAIIGSGKQLGEIDIIALDGDSIVFVEVKAWSAFGAEDLRFSINIKKQLKIIKTAKFFLSENREYSNMVIRFDVVFIKGCHIDHLVSAFTEGV